MVFHNNIAPLPGISSRRKTFYAGKTKPAQAARNHGRQQPLRGDAVPFGARGKRAYRNRKVPILRQTPDFQMPYFHRTRLRAQKPSNG